MNDGADKSVNASDLPQDNAGKRTEVYQYPQPADTDKAMKGEELPDPGLEGKSAERSSREEGFNEEQTPATSGAPGGPENKPE